MNKLVLSTRKLGDQAKIELINNGFDLIEKNFIEIEFNDISSTPNLDDIEIILISSQNAILSLIKNRLIHLLKNKPVYCVGKKTSELLIKHKVTPLNVYRNNREMGDALISKKLPALYICGNLRKNYLTRLFEKVGVELYTWEVYKTKLTPQIINTNANAILFFSPSGIKSYTVNNHIKNELLVCIGSTTAEEAKVYSSNIAIADQQEYESVVSKAIETLSKHEERSIS